MKKYTRTSVFAALGVAAALSLTACGGDDSGSDASGKSKGGSFSSSSSGGGDSSDSSNGGSSDGGTGGGDAENGGSGSGGSEAGNGNGNGNAKQGSGEGTEARAGKNGAGQDGQGVKYCKTAGLSMTATDEGGDSLENGNVVVTMTNTTGATCSVSGFPTVRLTDADNTTSAPLKRDNNQPRIAVLKTNEKAVFNISFDKSKGGEPGDSDPVELQVTPPHGKGFEKLHWPAGAIKGMSNATALVHPMHANP
ncbi:DUF4232 domain-containing protein [Streptomyces sp. NPDC048172]|uniref:DUF4232 domain-containing protein n=1 Tax=Streptomyces sp. NPDC048172 TaxID=3365505 RepID=UPI003723EAC9